MYQPLWQIWLNVVFIAFVARRAAVGVGLHWDDLGTLLRTSHISVLVVCAWAAIAVWLRAKWVIASLVLVAAAFTFSTAIELSRGPVLPAASMVAQVVLAWIGCGFLIRLAWRSEHPGGSRA